MIIFTFDSTHLAIAAENLLGNLKGARLIPLPPKISAGCGLSLKTENQDKQKAEDILNSAHVSFNAIYEYTEDGEYKKL